MSVSSPSQDTQSQNTPAEDAPAPKPRRLPLAYLPLIIFVAVMGLLFVRLFDGDPSRLPSALLNKSAPQFNLPALLTNVPGLSDKDLRQGHVTIVNIFASWCGPCHEENPQLVAFSQDKRLAAEGVKLVGIAYKDQRITPAVISAKRAILIRPSASI